MFESKRKIRKERDELILKNHALNVENMELRMLIPTDEEFNKTDLCKICKHCRGYNGYWVCELEKQSCKHFE